MRHRDGTYNLKVRRKLAIADLAEIFLHATIIAALTVAKLFLLITIELLVERSYGVRQRELLVVELCEDDQNRRRALVGEIVVTGTR